MAKSKKNDTDLNLVEFGKRIAMVRKDIFKLKQIEFAPLIGTSQGILSRLELGIGGNLHIVFDLVNFLNKNGFEGHFLFKDHFNLETIAVKKEALKQIEIIEEELANSFKKLKSFVN